MERSAGGLRAGVEGRAGVTKIGFSGEHKSATQALLTSSGSDVVKPVAKYGEDWMKNVVLRRVILYIAQNHGNMVAVAAQVLLFSVAKELSIEICLSYPCTKFGENL